MRERERKEREYIRKWDNKQEGIEEEKHGWRGKKGEFTIKDFNTVLSSANQCESLKKHCTFTSLQTVEPRSSGRRTDTESEHYTAVKNGQKKSENVIN